jgi:hypothetical protein
MLGFCFFSQPLALCCYRYWVKLSVSAATDTGIKIMNNNEEENEKLN